MDVTPRRSMSSSTASSASRLPWMSETTANTSELRGSDVARDAIEHAVDEAARLVRSVSLRELDRLVEDHARRRPGPSEQLRDRGPQHRAVGRAEPRERPVLGRLLQLAVDVAAAGVE